MTNVTIKVVKKKLLCIIKKKQRNDKKREKTGIDQWQIWKQMRKKENH